MKYDPWREYRDNPNGKWREYNRMRGEKRIEFLVPVRKIVSAFKWIFGKKEKRK